MAALLGPPTGARGIHAQAIALAVDVSRLPDGWTERETAAVLLVTAHQEGQFCIGCSRGDNGRACSTFQIHALSEKQCTDLERDPVYAARYAIWLIRLGAKQCPLHPLAPYAGSCTWKRSIEIGDRRWMHAVRIAGT